MQHENKRQLVMFACDRLEIACNAIRAAIRDVEIALGPYGHSAELEVISETLCGVKENFESKLARGDYEYQFTRSSNDDKKETC